MSYKCCKRGLILLMAELNKSVTLQTPSLCYAVSYAACVRSFIPPQVVHVKLQLVALVHVSLRLYGLPVDIVD